MNGTKFFMEKATRGVTETKFETRYLGYVIVLFRCDVYGCQELKLLGYKTLKAIKRAIKERVLLEKRRKKSMVYLMKRN